MKPIRVVILGNTFVGKTCLIHRLVKARFCESSNSTGDAAYHVLELPKDDVIYTLQIWDTAGQERYQATASFYCREAHCAILAFSLVDMASFQAIDHWIKVLNEAASSDSVHLLVMGNKCDLQEREVSDDEIRAFCQLRNLLYFQVSAKTGEGVDDAVRALLTRVIDEGENPKIVLERVNLTASNSETENKGCC
jgi:small GTP-binding protein